MAESIYLLPEESNNYLICKVCNGELIGVETPDLQHYGKLICSICGKWHKWLKAPDNDGKRTKTSAHEHLRDKATWCSFCGRTRDELNEKEVFHLHHGFPINEGGPDDPANCSVLCSACHKLAHWVRTYHFTHKLKNGGNNGPQDIL